MPYMKVENTRVSRIAVSRLHLSNGEVRKNQVLEFDVKTKKVVRFYPLEQEIAFTEWRGGDYFCRKRFGKTYLTIVGKACPHPSQLIIM